MKKYFVTFATICTLVTICTFVTFVAYAGIKGTKHDLSPYTEQGVLSLSPGQTIYAATPTEKCVFCHTPHASSGSYPLWNHKLSEATYSILGPPGESETRLTTPIPPEGSSKLCLGCHDGTVAIGAVLNTPGRGSTGSISMEREGVTVEYMPCGSDDYTCLGTNFVSSGKHLDGMGLGDHLVSIEYDSGLAAAKCINTGDMGLYDPVTFLPNDPVQLRRTEHNNQFPPDTHLGIQCRTCHDPHEETATTKCFLVNAVDSEGDTMNCTTCPCTQPGDNYDALCNTCHYTCP